MRKENKAGGGDKSDDGWGVWGEALCKYDIRVKPGRSELAMQNLGESGPGRGYSKCKGPEAGRNLACWSCHAVHCLGVASHLLCSSSSTLPDQGRQCLSKCHPVLPIPPCVAPDGNEVGALTHSRLAKCGTEPPWLSSFPWLATEEMLPVFTLLTAHSNPCWGFGQHAISRWARVTVYFIFKNSFCWFLSYYKSIICSL